MPQNDPAEISRAIAPHLPLLRRYARALTGSQRAGDDHTAATLEAILADHGAFDTTHGARVGLYAVFHAIWSSAGARVEGPDGSEGRLAEKAQDRLAPLLPEARVALLLSTLEEFAAEQVAAIMRIPVARAAGLIEAGEAEIQRQVRGRVLIIEDEPVIALDLRGIVESLGHAVVGVSDTRDRAVSAAHAEAPNLILADVLLADGSSGIDAVTQILSSFDVPVIFITAYPERLLTGARPEPTFLISKPFREAQVRAAIGQALFFETVVDSV